MRAWPEHAPAPAAESVIAACASCAERFRVHEHLGGHRMRCPDCGAWIDIPRPARPSRLELEVARTAGAPAVRGAGAVPAAYTPVEDLARDDGGLITVPTLDGEVYEGDIPSGAPMAPGAMRHVRADVRRRFTTRTILELILVLAAIALPFVVAELYLDPDARDVLAPLASLVGGIGVILVGMTAPKYAFGGLRAPRRPLMHFVEGAAVAGLAFAIVHFVGTALTDGGGPPLAGEHVPGLIDALGLWGTLGVMALAPAIFEELAFRGLLHGRLQALFGARAGLVLTAVAFALAHGVSAATPVHLSLGLYLGWLRDRSGSLGPGMVLHLIYNGALVLTA